MPDQQTTTRNPWAWIPTLYLAQGLPFAVVNSVSVIVYKSLGVSNADIAFYTAWLYLPWVIKPLWSPVVDILRTRRWWIWITQLLMGAGFAAVGLSLPLTGFFKASLALFYLIAFSSATHDIAADGFYMQALTEKQQAFFVGIRSTFFRISMIFGQGLLVILAGLIQSHTGLPKAQIKVEAKADAALIETVNITRLSTGTMPTPSPRDEGAGRGPGRGETLPGEKRDSSPQPSPPSREERELRVLVEPVEIQIAPQPRTKAEVAVLLGSVKNWNTTNNFLRTRQSAQAGSRQSSTNSWWTRGVSGPLENFLRTHHGRETATKSDVAGNVGIVALRLTKQPGKEIVVTPAFASGDKSVSLAEGSRLVFDDANWDKPALAVIQLDPKFKLTDNPKTWLQRLLSFFGMDSKSTQGKAVFEIRSGNIPLSWSVTFFVLVGLFALFGLWHKFILPSPASDQPGDAHNIPGFIKEFFKTFGSFFRKPKIAFLLLFLLLYRFGEAQLVKMVTPFLLDPREVGGLGLTTGQVGVVYGTIGILALTCGGLLGGMVASRHGLKAWLWPMVLIIHLPDAVFIYLAHAQPDNLAVISAAVAVEQFGYGFGFTAYMLYMIYIARGAHSTAHYAICTGFMALGMMLPGMWSGWLQEIIGYHHFFVWVILATIPSFLVVLLIPLDREFGKKS